MTGFLSNMLNRHCGACEMVQPRTRGRYESEGVSLSIDSISQGVQPFETEKGNSTNYEVAFHSAPQRSSAPDVVSFENEGDFDAPYSQKQETPLFDSIPTKQLGTKEENAQCVKANQHPTETSGKQQSSVETQGIHPPETALHNQVAKQSPVFGERPMDGLDGRINATMARLQESQDSQQAEYTESNNLLSAGEAKKQAPHGVEIEKNSKEGHALLVKAHQHSMETSGKQQSSVETQGIHPPETALYNQVAKQSPVFGERPMDGLDGRINATMARLQESPDSQQAEYTEPNNVLRADEAKKQAPLNLEENRTVQHQSITPLPEQRIEYARNGFPQLYGGDIAVEAPSSVSAHKKQPVDLSKNKSVEKPGLLESPSWLTEFQAEFNHRRQENNIKAKPEPVVNVTIGRVEVRAIQAETVKETTRRKKTIGVMSLDDYLKQRENRG